MVAHKFTLITRNKSFLQLRKNVIKHSVYGTNILFNNVQTCTQGRNWDASSPDLATYAGTFFSYAICLSNKFVIDQDDSYLDKHNHCVNEVDIKFCNSLLIANESNHSKIYLIPLYLNTHVMRVLCLANVIYTTFTNFSMEYHLMYKVYTDVGGIK